MASVKPVVISPKPNTIVWRYMNFHEFLTLIVNRRLMFRQYNELEKSDKQEGMIPHGFWEAWEDWKRRQDPTEDIREARRAAERALYRLRHFRYVNCWTAVNIESALMWMAYAPRGVAVRTTVGKLKEARLTNIDHCGPLHSRGMVYADAWLDLERHGFEHWGVVPNNLFLRIKRSLFAAEREVRFFIDPPMSEWPVLEPSPYGGLAASAEQCPPWFPVEFENLEWIDEVVVDSAVAPWSFETIKKLMEGHGVACRHSAR